MRTHLFSLPRYSVALVIALVLLVMGACGAGGYLVTKKQLAQIHIGVSTNKEVQDLLGSPKTIISADSSNHVNETWVYIFAKYSSDPHTGIPPIGMTSVPISRNRRRTPEVHILFNQNGVVTSIQEKSLP